jgi:hypothetical protein
MLSLTRTILASLLFVGLVQSFSLETCATRRGDSPSTESTARHMAAGLMLATGLLFSTDPALALPENSVNSLPPTLIAARSGGRAGGRAYRAPASARPSTSTYRSTTIVRPMIAAPPVIVSPFGGGYGYGGYGYSSPMSGFGLGYGLGAINSAGDSMRGKRRR